MLRVLLLTPEISVEGFALGWYRAPLALMHPASGWCGADADVYNQRLKEAAFGEIADQAEVGGEEIVAGEGWKWGPADLIEDAVVEVALEVVDDEELQVDGAAVAVLVAYTGYATANGGGDAQLFI
jgi:hypothetical protein